MSSAVETAGLLTAFCLTLMVYAYLGKDIPLLHGVYRVAVYLFVGVGLGYAAVMAWHGVLVPRFLSPLANGEWSYLVPLVMCLLLLSKVNRSWGGLGNVTLAFLFGVGAALAVGGGLIGTLLPQVEATFLSLNPAHYEGIAAREGSVPLVYVLNALLIVIGTVSSLLYFYFNTQGGARSLARLGEPILRFSVGFGKVFIMFTFGALFATTAISRISLLVDRVRFIIVTIWSFIP